MKYKLLTKAVEVSSLPVTIRSAKTGPVSGAEGDLHLLPRKHFPSVELFSECNINETRAHPHAEELCTGMRVLIVEQVRFECGDRTLRAWIPKHDLTPLRYILLHICRPQLIFRA